MSNDEPQPGRCNAKTRSGGHCENYPVDGSERCRMHGGTQGSSTDNPNYKHGAYSEHVLSDLSEREQKAHGVMTGTLAEGDPEDQRRLIAEAAAEAWLKYKRSGDSDLLREFRMFAEKFNLAPNSDKIEHDHGIEEAFMADLKRAAEMDE